MLFAHTVTFIGHRYIYDFNSVEGKLAKIIDKIISDNTFVRFLIGNDGDFDILATSIIKQIKKKRGAECCELCLVLPYEKRDFQNNQKEYEDYYDAIELSYEASKAHFKKAILTRNFEMVDRSDLLICYVTNNSGGAYKTMRYALNNCKKVLNIDDIT